ncbi:hypothetical protein [Fructobacillus ficulneus]|uniref:Uncharacterized protein n=1 Tax=Fructobacillus ficulneus TaxID=157463 RepID=A0A0K8MIF5_9LACO|nr:hypothetical protein [Fructobacillus ficulneus]GAP00352.1 hypothetical protein FFIC_283690 [Fructobacillus ficulneus]
MKDTNTAEKVQEYINGQDFKDYLKTKNFNDADKLGQAFIIPNWNSYVKDPAQFKNKKTEMIKDQAKFGQRGTVYAQKDKDKAQAHYEYVFVSVLENGKILVVGKSSFWSNTLENGRSDPSEDSTFGDLIKAYNDQVKQGASIASLKREYKLDDFDFDEKVTTVVIIPIDVSSYSRDVSRRGQDETDEITHEFEKMIGDFLLDSAGLEILNTYSHRL